MIAGTPISLVEHDDGAPLAAHLASSLAPEHAALASELAYYDNARDRDLRGRDHLFLVESDRVVRRFLRSHWPCRSLLMTPALWPSFEAAVAVRPESITVFLASERRMTGISGYRLHGGALAIGERGWKPPTTTDLFASLPATRPLRIVVCSGVRHVDNVGSLFRSVACLGGHGLLLEHDCADPLLRKAIRFSMGRVFETPWGMSQDLRADLSRLRDIGVRPIAIELADDARPLTDMPRKESLAIVLGSEAFGLRPEILSACDGTYAILGGGVDEDGQQRSLNVAVAGAIALNELTRAAR